MKCQTEDPTAWMHSVGPPVGRHRKMSSGYWPAMVRENQYNIFYFIGLLRGLEHPNVGFCLFSVKWLFLLLKHNLWHNWRTVSLWLFLHTEGQQFNMVMVFVHQQIVNKLWIKSVSTVSINFKCSLQDSTSKYIYLV